MESIANICKPFKPRSYLPVAPATCHLFSTTNRRGLQKPLLTQHLARPALGATADLEGCVDGGMSELMAAIFAMPPETLHHEVLYQHLPTVLQGPTRI